MVKNCIGNSKLAADDLYLEGKISSSQNRFHNGFSPWCWWRREMKWLQFLAADPLIPYQLPPHISWPV